MAELQGDWLQVVIEAVSVSAQAAGISSFGFSGTNAHVILASKNPVLPALPAPKAFRRQNHPWAFDLSVSKESAGKDYLFSMEWRDEAHSAHGTSGTQTYLVLSQWEDRNLLSAPGCIRACWQCPPERAMPADEDIIEVATDLEGLQRLVHAMSNVSAAILLCHQPQFAGCPDPDLHSLCCCLHLLQALMSSKAQQLRSLPVMIITSSAECLGHKETMNLSQAPLLGFVRAAAVEYSGRLHLMDVLPEELGDLDLTRAWRWPRQAFRARSCLHQVLVAENSQLASSKQTVVKGQTFVVSGGFGALGFEASSWLAREGVERLMLLGRSARTHKIPRMVDTEVLACQCDISDMQQVEWALSSAELGQVHGIVHAAGAASIELLQALKSSAFDELRGSAAYGAWNLHEASEELQSLKHLAHFILFSSSASVLPMEGQARYAAQNSFLDQLAAHRRQLGRSAVSINFGLWGEVGIGSDKEFRKRLKPGMGALTTDDALKAVELALRGSQQPLAIPLSWKQLSRHLDWSCLALAHEFVPQPTVPISGQLSRATILKILHTSVSKVLEREDTKIHVDDDFDSLGFDSLMLEALRRSVNEELGTQAVSATSKPQELLVRSVRSERCSICLQGEKRYMRLVVSTAWLKYPVLYPLSKKHGSLGQRGPFLITAASAAWQITLQVGLPKRYGRCRVLGSPLKPR